MVQPTWSNPVATLGSSYGPSVGANEIHKPIPQGLPPSNPLAVWASPSSLSNNIERERERERQPHPARPYPPSAYGADPYPYPPAHPSPPAIRQVVQEPQPLVQPYYGQQFLSQPMSQPPVQQQPLASSFGPVGPPPSQPVMLNTNRRPGDWDCPTCTAHNFASRSGCFKCGCMKPGGITRRPGDWWCGKCNGHNYAYRVDCFKCGADKADGNSEPLANASNAYGGRRAGDWDCPNCNAHCFASRMECFRCGEPKPVDLSTDD